MGLIYADSFDHYDTSRAYAKWDQRQFSVVTGGRRGTKAAYFNQGGAVRNVGSQTELIVGFAIFPEYSDYLAPLNKHQSMPFTNFCTSRAFIAGFGFAGIAHCGLAFSNDGALHVIRGAALDFSDSSLASTRVASSDPGKLALTGWSYVEVKINFAGVTVKVNRQEVISFVGSTRVMDENYSQFMIGAGSFGAIPGIGWRGKIDDLVVLNGSGDRNNDFLGDVRVDFLKPNGGGFHSDSIIQGTSPAPTRWQSVDDQTPDDDETYVNIAASAAIDTYAHENLNTDSATVFAVQHVAYVRKSEAGLAEVSGVQRYGGTTEPSAIVHRPAGGEFVYLLTPFDSSVDDNDWTKTRVDGSEFGLMRL